MNVTRRSLTELERRNVDTVAALINENDHLRERLANRNLVIVMLCVSIIVLSILAMLT